MDRIAAQLNLSEDAAWALAALIALQLICQAAALFDLYRRPSDQVRTGKKWFWAIVILLGELIGPIAYFAAGRVPPPAWDPPVTDVPEGEGDPAAKVVDLLYDDDPGRRPPRP